MRRERNGTEGKKREQNRREKDKKRMEENRRERIQKRRRDKREAKKLKKVLEIMENHLVAIEFGFTRS